MPTRSATLSILTPCQQRQIYSKLDDILRDEKNACRELSDDMPIHWEPHCFCLALLVDWLLMLTVTDKCPEL